MSDGEPRATFEIRTPDWLALDEARRRVLALAEPLETERATLEEALGRALAEPIAATATLPPWDNSAMDGYAVRAEEVSGASPGAPVVLPVAGVVHAGDVPSRPLEPGSAVRIMTGAPLPPGADSVVRAEDTDREATAGTVRILKDRDCGHNVRPAGQDTVVGDRVLERGESIGPGTVGVLAALGCTDVLVHRRALVSVVVTGNELRTPDRYDEVRSGMGVPESNGPMIAAQIASIGGIARRQGVAPDEAEALRGLLTAGLDADALITVGGASTGEADLVKGVLDGMEFQQEFWRVRMRPGSPFGFGWIERDEGPLPVFSLPGNPASAFVTFEMFVRPFLLRLMGHLRIHRRTLRCVAGTELRTPGRLTYVLRVQLDSTHAPPLAMPVGPQGSGLVRSLSAAQGLGMIPEDVEDVAEGGSLDVILLDDSPGVVEDDSTT